MYDVSAWSVISRWNSGLAYAVLEWFVNVKRCTLLLFHFQSRSGYWSCCCLFQFPFVKIFLWFFCIFLIHYRLRPIPEFWRRFFPCLSTPALHDFFISGSVTYFQKCISHIGRDTSLRACFGMSFLIDRNFRSSMVMMSVACLSQNAHVLFIKT